VGPLLLQDGHQDKVQLVEQGAFGAATIVVIRELEDEVDDEVANAWNCQLDLSRRRNAYCLP
jgi:hypothetical protein